MSGLLEEEPEAGLSEWFEAAAAFAALSGERLDEIYRHALLTRHQEREESRRRAGLHETASRVDPGPRGRA